MRGAFGNGFESALFITPPQLVHSAVQGTISKGLSSAEEVSVAAFTANEGSLFGPDSLEHQCIEAPTEPRARQDSSSIFVEMRQPDLYSHEMATNFSSGQLSCASSANYDHRRVAANVLPPRRHTQ